MSESGKPFDDLPFSYTEAKSGAVLISHRGRVVKTLQGKAAQTFLTRVSDCSEEECQKRMAKVTGQFKFGNERAAKDADASRFDDLS